MTDRKITPPVHRKAPASPSDIAEGRFDHYPQGSASFGAAYLKPSDAMNWLTWVTHFAYSFQWLATICARRPEFGQAVNAGLKRIIEDVLYRLDCRESDHSDPIYLGLFARLMLWKHLHGTLQQCISQFELRTAILRAVYRDADIDYGAEKGISDMMGSLPECLVSVSHVEDPTGRESCWHVAGRGMDTLDLIERLEDATRPTPHTPINYAIWANDVITAVQQAGDVYAYYVGLQIRTGELVSSDPAFDFANLVKTYQSQLAYWPQERATGTQTISEGDFVEISCVE